MKIIPEIKILRHQSEFCDLTSAKITGLVGGVGSGKTQGLVYRTLSIFKKRNGKARVLVIEPTVSMNKDIVLPCFSEIFERYRIKYVYKASEGKIITRFGEIMLRSADRPERLRGLNVTDFIADEIDSLPERKARDVFNELLARIRTVEDATAGLCSSPEGYGFLYNLFVTENKDNSKKLIKAKTTDNPFLPKDYIQALYDNYDERLIKQYINGEFVNLNSGQVYYAFDREKHVRKDIKYQDCLPVIFTFDFNVNPMTCCVVQWNRKELQVIDEFYLENSNTEKMAHEICNKYNKSINAIICGDASGNSRSTQSSETDFKIIYNIFLEHFNSVQMKVPKSNGAIKDRINNVNSALSKGKLTFKILCDNIIRDLEQVVYKDNGDVDSRNHKLTHISDALGYCVNQYLPIRKLIGSYKNYMSMSTYESAF